MTSVNMDFPIETNRSITLQPYTIFSQEPFATDKIESFYILTFIFIIFNEVFIFRVTSKHINRLVSISNI